MQFSWSCCASNVERTTYTLANVFLGDGEFVEQGPLPVGDERVAVAPDRVRPALLLVDHVDTGEQPDQRDDSDRQAHRRRRNAGAGASTRSAGAIPASTAETRFQALEQLIQIRWPATARLAAAC